MKSDHAPELQSNGDHNPITDQVLPPSFAFNDAVADIAAIIRDEARRFEERRRFKVVDRGFKLLDAKAKIPRGYFEKFVKDKCHMSASTAQRAMRAARTLRINKKLSYLSQRGLWHLRRALRRSRP